MKANDMLMRTLESDVDSQQTHIGNQKRKYEDMSSKGDYERSNSKCHIEGTLHVET